MFGRSEVEELIEAVSRIRDRASIRTRTGVYAVRNLLEVSPVIRKLADSAKGRALAGGGFPVRGTLFDKTVGANWLVPWHQDLTICVAERVETPEFGPWTVKAGVWHVQPPAGVLEKMISVRIHLDDCGADNGALRVLPGTHLSGRFSSARIAELAREITPVCCAVKAGDVVLMRPLAVHASPAAANAGHRRVVHIDYAFEALPGGLQWRWAG